MMPQNDPLAAVKEFTESWRELIGVEMAGHLRALAQECERLRAERDRSNLELIAISDIAKKWRNEQLDISLDDFMTASRFVAHIVAELVDQKHRIAAAKAGSAPTVKDSLTVETGPPCSRCEGSGVEFGALSGWPNRCRRCNGSRVEVAGSAPKAEPILNGVFEHQAGCRAPDYMECTCKSVQPEPIQIGDTVTADSWEGKTQVVTGFVDGPERCATFERGGFWRVSQLRKVAGSAKGQSNGE